MVGEDSACAVQPDSRFEHVVGLIRKGVFGWADFFEPLVDSVTSGGDYYLLANDFPSYIEAQVSFRPATIFGHLLHCSCLCPTPVILNAWECLLLSA